MYGISIDIRDEASPAVARLLTELADRKGTREVAGREGRNRVRDYLFKHDADNPNELGGNRTHFFAAAARSTNYRLVGNGVVISINHTGIAQRYFGGRIAPVKGKYLSIPARAEAYGKRVREFSYLEVVFGRGGKPIGLAEAERQDISVVRDRKAGREGRKVVAGDVRQGGAILFWLVKEVNQDPDPTVLPPMDELGDAIASRVLKYISRVYAVGGTGASDNG